MSALQPRSRSPELVDQSVDKTVQIEPFASINSITMMNALSLSSLRTTISFSDRTKIQCSPRPSSQRFQLTTRKARISSSLDIQPEMKNVAEKAEINVPGVNGSAGEKLKPDASVPFAHLPREEKGVAEKNTVPVVGWAARDSSGHLSPFSFKRRETGVKDIAFDVKFCGICHTDLHHIKNEWGDSQYPMVPGHEIVGIVTNVGSQVTRFKVGDHIGVGLIVNSCKDCSPCKQNLEQYCKKKFVWTYGDFDADGSRTFGGFSNKMVVREDFALKLPKHMPMDKIAPLLCAGITVYSPMKHYEMAKGGKNFGIVGLGGLGHMAVKIAKAFGMNVTVISNTDKNEKEAREGLGADHFLVNEDAAQMEAAAETLDFIIDTVAAPHPTDPYLELLKINGKLIILGLPPGNMTLKPTSLIYGRKTLGGSLIGGIAETQEMLDFCGEHDVTCEIETIPISYLNEAMIRLAKGDVHYRFVIDVSNSLKPEQ